jgi:hypothetical protein
VALQAFNSVPADAHPLPSLSAVLRQKEAGRDLRFDRPLGRLQVTAESAVALGDGQTRILALFTSLLV